jgi:hypothetical protein
LEIQLEKRCQHALQARTIQISAIAKMLKYSGFHTMEGQMVFKMAHQIFEPQLMFPFGFPIAFPYGFPISQSILPMPTTNPSPSTIPGRLGNLLNEC